MEQLLLAAIIACSTGQATCSSFETDTYTHVQVCDVTPNQSGKREVLVNLDGKPHLLVLKGQCSDA